MKKLYFLSILNKYYLNGLCERVKISIKDKTLHTKFITTNKNLVGAITANEVELEDCEFGVYDSSQLLKLVSITDLLIQLNINKQGKVANKLFIKDKEYDLEYILADINLTPSIPTIPEPNYEISLDISEEFVIKFLKAKKAIDTELFTIESSTSFEGDSVATFILGNKDSHSNKISFDIPSTSTLTPGTGISFPLQEFAEILSANKEFTSCKINLNKEGLLKIEFIGENINSLYFLVGRE